MDITTLNPSFHPIRSAMVDEKIFAADAGAIPVSGVETERFDYDKVMMDLDEVRNFLYMLIGAEIQLKQDERIGAMVDRVA